MKEEKVEKGMKERRIRIFNTEIAIKRLPKNSGQPKILNTYYPKKWITLS